MRYLVAYEASVPAMREMPHLVAALRTLHAVRVLPTTWVLESELAPGELARHLIAVGHLVPDDRLLVTTLGGAASYRKLLVTDQHAATLLA